MFFVLIPIWGFGQGWLYPGQRNVFYALMPGGMKGCLNQINEMSPDQLRLAGLVAVGAGVGLVWWVLK